MKYVSPTAAPGGDGSSYSSALNTLDGNTTGVYILGPGLYPPVRINRPGTVLIALDTANPPILSGGGGAVSPLDFNRQWGCEAYYLDLTGNKGAAPSAGARMSGNNNLLYGCRLYDNRFGVHVLGANSVVQACEVDVGRADELSVGVGVRVNGAAAANSIVAGNNVYSSRGYAQIPGTFGTGIEVYGAHSTALLRNILHAAMCDQIMVRARATSTTIGVNLCFGEGMLDGIDVVDSDGALVYNNTVKHPGDVVGHDGPGYVVGDDYGVELPATNVVYINNLWAVTNRLCGSIRPEGDGLYWDHDWLHRVGQGSALVNIQGPTGFIATDFAAWAARANVFSPLTGDPLVNSAGIPLGGSPLSYSGADLGPMLDVFGRVGRGFVGAVA